MKPEFDEGDSLEGSNDGLAVDSAHVGVALDHEVASHAPILAP